MEKGNIKNNILKEYINNTDIVPLFIEGNALNILKETPNESINCIITSPPYWKKRKYINGGIGLEATFKDFIKNILKITNELKRVLKNDGSFWLNIGDTYFNKNLLGIPWRVALAMADEQNWILRNSVIWNKQKGAMDSSKDKLRNVHENLFHFVKNAKGYYYDDNSIRNTPRKTKVVNGAVVSATGVSGIRYKRQIELSTSLTNEEKQNAIRELDAVLIQIQRSEISDFRMIIRNQQRTTHSNSEEVSGRAKELKEKGFYFLKYNPNGTLPTDVWDILPEDTQKRKKHYAVFPEELCNIPIIATCPQEGIVLDPFCGTGTTMYVAQKLNRKSIGIDIAGDYIDIAKSRVDNYGQQSLRIF